MFPSIDQVNSELHTQNLNFILYFQLDIFALLTHSSSPLA
jgi:hypothetical protein